MVESRYNQDGKRGWMGIIRNGKARWLARATAPTRNSIDHGRNGIPKPSCNNASGTIISAHLEAGPWVEYAIAANDKIVGIVIKELWGTGHSIPRSNAKLEEA